MQGGLVARDACMRPHLHLTWCCARWRVCRCRRCCCCLQEVIEVLQDVWLQDDDY
jgi:hypothetical protein